MRYLLVSIDNANAPDVAHVVSEFYLGYGVDDADVPGVHVRELAADVPAELERERTQNLRTLEHLRWTLMELGPEPPWTDPSPLLSAWKWLLQCENARAARPTPPNAADERVPTVNPYRAAAARAALSTPRDPNELNTGVRMNSLASQEAPKRYVDVVSGSKNRVTTIIEPLGSQEAPKA